MKSSSDRCPCRTEPVLDIGRHRDERAWLGASPLAGDEELDLALEHVERVGVGRVSVWVDALEVGREVELERLDVWQLGEDAVPALSDPLALALSDEVRLVHLRPS